MTQLCDKGVKGLRVRLGGALRAVMWGGVELAALATAAALAGPFSAAASILRASISFTAYHKGTLTGAGSSTGQTMHTVKPSRAGLAETLLAPSSAAVLCEQRRLAASWQKQRSAHRHTSPQPPLHRHRPASALACSSAPPALYTMPPITEQLLVRRAEHNDGCLRTLQEVALHGQGIERIEVLGQLCAHLRILLLQNNLISKIQGLHRLKVWLWRGS